MEFSNRILRAILKGLNEALAGMDIDLDNLNQKKETISNDQIIHTGKAISQKYNCDVEQIFNNILQLNSDPYCPPIDNIENVTQVVEVFNNEKVPFITFPRSSSEKFDFQRLLSASDFYSISKKAYESCECTGNANQLLAFKYLKETYFHAYNAATEIHIDKEGSIVLVNITDRYYFVLVNLGTTAYDDTYHYLNDDLFVKRLFKPALSKVFTPKIANEILLYLPIIKDTDGTPYIHYRFYKYKPEFIKFYIYTIGEQHLSKIPVLEDVEYHSSSDISGLKKNIVLTYTLEPNDYYTFDIRLE